MTNKETTMTLTKEQREAIEYFLGWGDGDNLTVTCDFLQHAEELGKLL